MNPKVRTLLMMITSLESTRSPRRGFACTILRGGDALGKEDLAGDRRRGIGRQACLLNRGRITGNLREEPRILDPVEPGDKAGEALDADPETG